jgi:hypothetical protein
MHFVETHNAMGDLNKLGYEIDFEREKDYLSSFIWVRISKRREDGVLLSVKFTYGGTATQSDFDYMVKNAMHKIDCRMLYHKVNNVLGSNMSSEELSRIISEK